MLEVGVTPTLAADLGGLSLSNENGKISAQVAEPSEPLAGNQDLEKYKTSTLQAVSSLAPQTLVNGSSAKDALSSYIAQLKSSDPTSAATATDAAWSDFDHRFSLATVNQSLPQIDTVKQLSIDPQSLQSTLIGYGFKQPIAPESTMGPIQSDHWIADKTNILSQLLPSHSSSAKTAAADLPVNATPANIDGWFCNVDGSSGFNPKANVGGEGEDPSVGSDSSGSGSSSSGDD